MSTIYESFGKKVREYRKAKDYSTVDLATHLGVSVGLINNLENGRNDVFKLEFLMKIMQEINLPLEELLQLTPISIRRVYIQEDQNTLFIKATDGEADEVVQYINQHLNLVTKSFLTTITEYGCSKEVIDDISRSITNNLEIMRNLNSYKSHVEAPDC